MSPILLEMGIFTGKTLIIVLAIIFVLIAFFALLAKGKDKQKGRLTLKHLNKKYDDFQELLLAETLPKKLFKNFLKDQKAKHKKQNRSEENSRKVYVLNFNGDMKASSVDNLREEITAILSVVNNQDEVVLRLESPGGMVHGYGLAAAQLMRIRDKHIPLTVIVDKVAASGGYMMACIGNKILSSPFAILGSIGVIIQLPNFHRLLKSKHIDFEQHTAGQFKRTITVFGENTEAGREKLQEEIEDIHQHFKNLIVEYRPKVNIEKVATGEHWLGQQALTLDLVDGIQTSDEYLFECSKHSQVYEISYQIKKPLSSKLFGGISRLYEEHFGMRAESLK